MLGIKEKLVDPYILQTVHKSVTCGTVPIEYPEYNILHGHKTVFKTLNERIALNAKIFFNAAHILGSQSIPHFLLHDKNNDHKEPYTLKMLTNSKGINVFIILECYHNQVCEFHARDQYSLERLVKALNAAYVDAFHEANIHINAPYIEHNELFM